MVPAPHSETNANRLQPNEGVDECGPTLGNNKLLIIEQGRKDRKMLERLHIDSNEVPMYPRFATYEERLRTFEHWPAGIPVTPEALSEAGFFYSSHGDRTYCFQCGCTLQGWSEDDDPRSEHARWFPDCKLVSSLRDNIVTDDPSVQEFRNRARAQEDMQEALKTIRDLVSSIDINKVNPTDMKSTLETLRYIVNTVDTRRDHLGVHERNDAESDSDSEDQQPVSLEESESSSSSNSNPNSLSCVICLTRARNALLLPCRHIATCCRCAHKLKTCCVCRLKVSFYEKVYIP